MELSDFDSSLVTVGQSAEGGSCYVSFDEAPDYPADATTALGEGWESAGDLSTNGYTEGKSVTSTDHKNWRGSVVLTTIDEETNTYKAEFIEVNRPTAAKMRYGAGNIAIDEATGQVKQISGKPGQVKPVGLVFEELESSGYKRRTVVKKAMVTSFDDVPHQKGSLMVYGMTFTANEVGGSAFEIYRAKPVTV